MLTRRALLASAAGLLRAQEADPLFSCPMDPDVRTKGPGKCPKCGMSLRPGVVELSEYGLDLEVNPPAAPSGQPIELTFRVRQPNGGKQVRDFEVIHERLFHQFIVSHDLEYFAHEHPELAKDGSFRLKLTLPKPGIYRLLSDFYPAAASPQLISRTLITSDWRGPFKPRTLPPDFNSKKAQNLEIGLRVEPAQPLAGKKSLLFFDVSPAAGLEPYLGAWAHLLAVSHDLMEAIHGHPSIAEGGPQVQFDVFFPRQARYRIWVQMQRNGVVNTAGFTIPVVKL